MPEPYGAELTKWREDLGDPLALAIPPHVTLITPTDVDDDAVGGGRLAPRDRRGPAVAVRDPAARDRQLPPVSPVVFVALAAGISDCERVERAVRSGPLGHPLKFNYHPHVTVAHDVPPDVLDHAFRELADYEASFTVEHFGLFERGDDGVWRTDRDFAFGLSAPEGSTSS